MTFYNMKQEDLYVVYEKSIITIICICSYPYSSFIVTIITIQLFFVESQQLNLFSVLTVL